MTTKPVSNNEISCFMVWLEAWHDALSKVFGESGHTDVEVLEQAMKLAPWDSKEGV